MRYRELSEISLAHDFHDEDDWDKTGAMAYDSRQHSLDFGDEGDYSPMGKIDGFDVVQQFGDNQDDESMTIKVVVFDKGERIAYLQGEPINIIDDAVQIKGVRVDPRYSGRGLGMKLYEFILEHNLCGAIVADDHQTPEGVRLWNAMFASARFKLFMLDDRKGDTIPIKNPKMLKQVYGKYDRDYVYLVATL